MGDYLQLAIAGAGPKPKPKRQKPETAWKLQVLGIAADNGWRFFHVPDELLALAAGAIKRSPRRVNLLPPPGWPDLALCRREPDGTVRLVVAELKSKDGSPSPEQRDWLALLADVAGVEAYLWRPKDLPRVTEVLRRRTLKELLAAA